MNQKYKQFKMVMIIMSVVGAIVSMIVPVMISVWNYTEINIDGGKLFFVATVLAAGLTLNIALVYFRERFAKNYNKYNLRCLLEKYFKLKYDYILDNGPSNILERCQNAVNETYFYMTGSAIELWSAAIIIIASIILMALNNIYIAGIMLIMIPINYFGYRMLNKELAKRSEELQTNSAKGFQVLLSYIGNVDYIKQCASSKEMCDQLDYAEELLYKSMERINVFAQGASQGISAVNTFAQTLSMLIIVYQITANNGNPMSYVLYFTLFPLFFQKITTITKINLDKQKLIVAQKYIEELDANLETDAGAKLDNIYSVTLDVNELRIKENTIDVNVKGTFSKGSIIRIGGKSGAGKSTLAKTLLKFRDSNGIKINGTELRGISNTSLREKVYYLSQNVTIINDTLRNNLFLNRKWSREDEEKLLKMDILKPILERMSLDSMISEGGTNLSGGEKQRVAIARAILENPDIAIYDEISSNLDKESVKAIWDEMLAGHEDKIVFIISHDDSVDEYITDFLSIS